MRQLVLEDGVLEGGGDMRLPYDRGEILRTVFSGGNDEVVHTDKVKQIGLRMELPVIRFPVLELFHIFMRYRMWLLLFIRPSSI